MDRGEPTVAKYDHLRCALLSGTIFMIRDWRLGSKIIPGDGVYRYTGYVMAHQLFKLYLLEGRVYWVSVIILGNGRSTVDEPWQNRGGPTVAKYDQCVWRQILEGIQLEQLMNHYITRIYYNPYRGMHRRQVQSNARH